MRVIKRDGSETTFDPAKIVNAVLKANKEVEDYDKITEADASKVASRVTEACEALEHAVNVEEIQDLVEKALISLGYSVLMRAYTTYRWKRAAERRGNTTDGKILSLLNRKNEDAIQENSNKNPIVNSTLRDYMAGEVSKDICKRFLYPKHIMDAHEEGIIHQHDLDYIAAPLHNCDLINLEDMLQNGTVISNTKIDKPHRFLTACNIATQVIAQVASCQYGFLIAV